MKHVRLKYLLPLTLLLILCPTVWGQDDKEPSLFDLDHSGDVTFGEVVSAIWHYPLYDAGEHQIHVNQIVLALLVVLLGVWISKRLSMVTRKRITRFSRIDDHIGALVQKVLFYTMVIVITLIALPFIGVPMTVFTVVGGALAIGIGFGAQNLISNFLSGLIIMIEQPIRLGDIVEVDGDEGRIDEIGSRATRVRRSDGIEIVVPNSQFLDNMVVNWTLSDNQVRGEVAVGVAYGSPTDKVAQLLRQAAHEHEKILKSPEPIILFQDFGDNALGFKIYFWAHIDRPMDMRIVKSDVRFSIDKLFAEASISIAFPQRDIHLDSAKPIEVRIANDQRDSNL
jgi:small-conductance mechanosensitive channel